MNRKADKKSVEQDQISKKKKVSFCIPTFNRKKILKKCIDSIISYNWTVPYEIVVVDGGSTDGTIEYLEEIKSDNVVPVLQGGLKGLAKAWHDGYAAARGDYVFLGNDDISIFPKSFEVASRFLDKEKNIGVVFIRESEIPLKSWYYPTMHGIKWYGMIIGRFLLFRRNLMVFDYENLNKNLIEEDVLLNIVSKGYTCIGMKQIGMIHYVIHDESRRTISNKKAYFKERNYFMNKWKNLMKTAHKYYHDEIEKSEVRGQLFEGMFRHYNFNFNEMKTIFDILYEHIPAFPDHKYDNLNDFYMAQRFPKEILDEINHN